MHPEDSSQSQFSSLDKSLFMFYLPTTRHCHTIKTTLPVELEARCEDAVAGSTSAEKVMDSAGEYRCNS